jgi:hypothetical protein
MNTEIEFVAVNAGGVVKLSNNTFWRVALGHISRVQSWQKGERITIQPSDDPISKTKLVNLNKDNEASATETLVRF